MKKTLVSHVFLPGVLALLLLLTAQLAANAAMNTDADLDSRVEKALEGYKDISVKTDNGIITLKGNVADSKEKAEAVRRAREVRGVMGVQDELTYKDASSESLGEYLDDASVTAAVKGKFLGEKGLDSLDISVKTTEGVVTLTGKVENSAQIGLAEQVAKEVKGVRKINNMLNVKS